MTFNTASPSPGFRMGVGMVEGTPMQIMLAYNEMTVGKNGSILDNDQKRQMREKKGYCVECEGIPILLYNIKKNTFNPLWVTKEPRAVAGECAGGVCFPCHPSRDPTRRRRTITTQANFRSPILPGGRQTGRYSDISQINRLPHVSEFRNSSPAMLQRGSPHHIRTPNAPASHHPEGYSSEELNMPRAPELETRRTSAPITPTQNLFHGASHHKRVSDNSVAARKYSEHSTGENPSSSARTSSSGALNTSESQRSSHDDSDVIISQLDSLVSDMLGADSGLLGAENSADFLAEIILGGMREHNSNEEVLIYCLGIIWESCRGHENKKEAIMRSGGAKDILCAMNTFPNSQRLQEVGCGAIWSLSIKKQNRIDFIQGGACAIIMQAVESFVATEEVISSALGAARTLSPESKARDLLQRLEGSRLVTQAMTTHPFVDSIQRDGCAFLSNSAVNLEKQHVLVVPTSELEAVVQAMANHKYDPSVMKGACFALKNYTFDDTNCRRLRKIKDANELLNYATTYAACPEGMDDACDILDSMRLTKSLDDSIEDQALISITSAVESQIRTSEVRHCILDFMAENDWSPKLTMYGLKLLNRIVCVEVSHRDGLFNSKQIPLIIEFSIEQKDDEIVCKEACNLIAHLAEEEIRHRELVQSGALEIIFHSLSFSRNAGLARAALGALQLLTSTTSSGCMIEAKKKIDLIRNAVELNPNDEVVAVSGIAILSLIE